MTGTTVVIMGDFNCVLNKEQDKITKGENLGGTSSPLHTFLLEVEWKDIWRTRNPKNNTHLCYNKSRRTMSRIDMVIASNSAFP